MMNSKALCDLAPDCPFTLTPSPPPPSSGGCSHPSYISVSQGLVLSSFLPEDLFLNVDDLSSRFHLSLLFVFFHYAYLHFITLELFYSFARLPISYLSLPASM